MEKERENVMNIKEHIQNQSASSSKNAITWGLKDLQTRGLVLHSALK